MNNSFQITGVRAILNIERPIIVLEVAGGNNIVRNPKQMLTDLQNSFRASKIDPKAFANGYANADQFAKQAFIAELSKLNKATIQGDIRQVKAGDEYEVSEGHPALTDAKHPAFGVKLGEKLKAEKDGVWVEGFLSIPFTEQEQLRTELTDKTATLLAQMMGIGSTAFASSQPTQQFLTIEEPTEDDADVTAREAIGSGNKKK